VFDLTLVDHLRMSFGHVVHRHRAHTQVAHSRSQWNRGLRAAEALLMTGVAVATLAAAFGRGYGYGIASAVLAVLALAVLLLHVTFDPERSAQAHAACAAQLWHIREQYRALLSDLSDGAIDVDTARRRRDELTTELRGVYENAPPADHQAYQTAGESLRTADERALADEEIDQFLPKSLQTAGKSARA
jgi:ABC-type transport system involved in cytochrome bd biosynthesis fused ATPase/permease subunit